MRHYLFGFRVAMIEDFHPRDRVIRTAQIESGFKSIPFTKLSTTSVE
jgi:hypothetical protein